MNPHARATGWFVLVVLIAVFPWIAAIWTGDDRWRETALLILGIYVGVIVIGLAVVTISNSQKK